MGGFFSAIGSFIGGVFSAIGGFFSGFFGGAFGRGGSSGGSGGSSGGSSGGGGSMSVLPQSSRAGSGPSSSEVSQSFIASAYNFGSSVGSALGGIFKAATLNIGGAGFEGTTNWLGGKGFRTDATVQAEQKQLGKLQEMIDQSRVEGGIAGQVASSLDSSNSSSLGNALEYPLTTLGKIGLSIGSDYLKADVFPLARATAKVGGAVLTGIALGTDVAQFYAPKTWSMRVHDAALVISDAASMVSPFLPPVAKHLRWTSTAAHVWDKFTQEQSDRIYGNK